MTDWLTERRAVQQGGSPQHAREDMPQEEDSEESIEAVENLLESYFMQIDSLYDRLVSMGEPCASTRSLPAWSPPCCSALAPVSMVGRWWGLP